MIIERIRCGKIRNLFQLRLAVRGGDLPAEIRDEYQRSVRPAARVHQLRQRLPGELGRQRGGVHQTLKYARQRGQAGAAFGRSPGRSVLHLRLSWRDTSWVYEANRHIDSRNVLSSSVLRD